MVLEHIFPEDWLEHKGLYAFILGVAYSIIGLILSSILFPSDPALVAVAITSLLLLPEMYKIFSIEERQESMEQKVTLGELWKDDFSVVRIYVFLFLGILLVYSLGAIFLPQMHSNLLFREQLEIRYCQPQDPSYPNCDLDQTLAGKASTSSMGTEFFDTSLFWILLSNNFLVLIACFIMALLTGDGAILLIAWNASTWGTIFGITAKFAGEYSGKPALYFFGIILLVVFPHMLLEAISYILAAISGSVISKDVLLENFASDRFFEVFGFNLYLLVFALIFLVLGAVAETLVLNHVAVYDQIINMARMVAGF